MLRRFFSTSDNENYYANHAPEDWNTALWLGWQKLSWNYSKHLFKSTCQPLSVRAVVAWNVNQDLNVCTFPDLCCTYTVLVETHAISLLQLCAGHVCL